MTKLLMKLKENLRQFPQSAYNTKQYSTEKMHGSERYNPPANMSNIPVLRRQKKMWNGKPTLMRNFS